MIQSNTIFFNMILLLLGMCAFAQNYPIPQNAMAVIVLNSKSFNSKIDFDKLFRKQIFQDLDAQFNDKLPGFTGFSDVLLKSPAEFGLTFEPNSLLWISYEEDGLSLIGYCAKLLNPEQFESGILANLKAKTTSGRTGDFKTITLESEDIVLAWNSQTAMIITSAPKNAPKNTQEDNQLPDSVRLLEKARQLDKQAAQAAQMKDRAKKNILKLIETFAFSKKQTLYENPDFKKFLDKRFDIGFWLNTEYLNRLGIRQNPAADMALSLPGFEPLANFTKDSYIHAMLNFDKGSVNLKIEQILSPASQKYAAALYAPKIQPSSLAFLNGTSPLGVGSLAFDIKAILGEAYQKNYENIKAFVAAKPAQNVYQQELFNILLDEKRIFGLFGKDVTIAVTGFVSQNKTYTDYQYNEKDEMIEVKKTKTIQKPKITAIVSISNRTDMVKVLDFLVNEKILAKHKKGIYTIVSSNNADSEISASDFKITLLPSHLLISSDPELIKRGFRPLKKPLSDTFMKPLTSHNNSVFIFDYQAIVSVLLSQSPSMDAKITEQAKLAQSGFGFIKFITAYNTSENQIETVFDIETADKAKNSLEAIFDIINEIYLRK